MYSETATPMRVYEPTSAGDAKDEDEEPLISTLSCLLIMIQCVRERMTRMQSKSLRKLWMKLCGDIRQGASPEANARPRHFRIQDQ
jgi:hypothetical protein